MTVNTVADSNVGQAPALAFDASANPKQYLALAGQEGFQDFRGGLTVLAVAKFKTPGNWERLMDFGAGMANNNIVLSRAGASNDLQLEVWDGTNKTYLTVPNAVIINEWHAYAMTISGKGADGMARACVYRDGVQLACGRVAVIPSVARNTCYVARSNWTEGSGFFNGELGSFLLYKTELTDGDIFNLSCSLRTPLMVLRFDSSSGTMTDHSGNGNEATADHPSV
ncbi:MAG: Glucose-methanol-choline oxidoreductase [Rhodospirillaceae bacterium]|nr:MAG: Glucose-methanol-choline oxidoreductase [Rhodospirillaceae bacterium]